MKDLGNIESIRNAYKDRTEFITKIDFREKSELLFEKDALGEHGKEMLLRSEPYSENARKLVEAVLPLVPLGKTGPKTPIKKALGAVIADLINVIADDPIGYCYRKVGRDSFGGQEIGCGPFTKARKALEAEELVIVQIGRRSVGRRYGDACATRFRPTDKLLALAAKHGITPLTYQDHFKPLRSPEKVAKPIVLKTASEPNYRSGRKKEPGKEMTFNAHDPLVIAAESQVQEINAAMSKATLSFPFLGFQRIFNAGDTTGFNWNFGGRLIGNYQNWEKEKRFAILINGESVGEVDLSSSHLSIALISMGFEFDTSRDYYAKDEYPRCIKKSFVNASLTNSSILKRWSPELIEEYSKNENKKGQQKWRDALNNESFGWTGDIKNDYPVKDIRDSVLKSIPELTSIKGSGINWKHLQHVESVIVINTVHELCTIHNIPVLPIHDSIIGPRSKMPIIEDCFSRNYELILRAKPKITRK